MARIETQGLLGDKIIEITLGTAGGARRCKPGDVIASRAAGYRSRDAESGHARQERRRRWPTSLRETGADAEPAGADRGGDRHRRTSATQATVRSARRIADRSRRARAGPRAGLRRAGGAAPAERILTSHPGAARPGRAGDSAVGVLLSPDSGKSAARCSPRWTRSRAGRRASRSRDEGLLPRAALRSRSTSRSPTISGSVAQNFRDVSERLARARACWVSSRRTAARTARGLGRGRRRTSSAAMANLRAITDRIKAGRGHGRRADRGPDGVREPRARSSTAPSGASCCAPDPLDHRHGGARATKARERRSADGARARRSIAARSAASRRPSPAPARTARAAGELRAARRGAGRARAAARRARRRRPASRPAAHPAIVAWARGRPRLDRHRRAGPRPGRRRGARARWS